MRKTGQSYLLRFAAVAVFLAVCAYAAAWLVNGLGGGVRKATVHGCEITESAAIEGIAVRTEEPLPALPVTMGETDSVSLTLPPDALTAVVEKAQAAALERRIDLPESLPAPVRQGQQVGTLTLCSGDTELVTVPILAAEDAAGRSWGRMFTDLLKMAVFAG